LPEPVVLKMKDDVTVERRVFFARGRKA